MESSRFYQVNFEKKTLINRISITMNRDFQFLFFFLFLTKISLRLHYIFNGTIKWIGFSMKRFILSSNLLCSTKNIIYMSLQQFNQKLNKFRAPILFIIFLKSNSLLIIILLIKMTKKKKIQV